MSLGQSPPPVTLDLNVWAQKLVSYLRRTASRLQFKPTDAPATENGVILWDVAGYPVVSKDGEWRQVVLADGFARLSQDVNITAAAADTAYKIAFDLVEADSITLTGSPLTEITFTEPGLYHIAFSAQISSTSGSSVTFRFWPRINTIDADSTIVASLHNNGETTVVSRSALTRVNAGDVLNAMWAVSDTNGYLHAHSATSYAPAAPSVTLRIFRVMA